MTISSTATVSGPSSVFTRPRSVGQKASLVEAISALYLEPTLEPERTTPPGNGMMTSGTVADRVDRGLGRGQRPARSSAEDQQVAAADRCDDAGGLLDDELAVHHRHAPVALAAESLGDLAAVAEEAQVLAERRCACRLRRRRSRPSRGRSARTGRRGSSSCFAELLAREREQQHAHAGPAVGRLLGRQLALDAGLGSRSR